MAAPSQPMSSRGPPPRPARKDPFHGAFADRTINRPVTVYNGIATNHWPRIYLGLRRGRTH